MSDSGGRPAPVPGVVDGALVVCLAANREVSFHVEFGSDDGRTGEHIRFEFILRPEHAEIVRSALMVDGAQAPSTGSGPSSVPCQIGIHVHH
ncbi:hypothetical protein [Streptomyces sp. NPDC004629]|uniref:hypothetical protein n=1 Tax=Streptomyces sp. NPDC004629 TaxID=3364705 RepID=UPI00369ADE4C